MVWEERWHPLREEWVIVAAHRQDRPWSGETVKHENGPRPPYVEDCYLCPGNARVSGAVNPQYTGSSLITIIPASDWRRPRHL